MLSAHPYLYFAGNTEEAFKFYRSVFGGDFLSILRYRDFGEASGDVPEGERDKIAHIALPLGEGTLLMGTDVLESQGQPLTPGNNFSINLDMGSTEEAERLFAALSEGGSVEMPLQRTEWAEQYGICADRFGMQWMVNYTGSVEFSAAPS
jgi:PhnB protein